jgi:hypothetical protein
MAAKVKVKGGVLQSRLSFVEKHGGKAGLERVLARLTPGDRAVLAGLLPSAWYPFVVGQRLDAAIFAELGGGRPDFFLRLGAASADKNLGGVHRAFLRPGDAHGFLAQTPEIYSFYYDQGRRTYEPVGEHEAVLVTHDAETFSEADCLTVVGWHRRALEMCGVGGVEVVEEECRARGGAVCRYRVRWA